MATRKSQLFLNSVLPVTRSHDELIRDKLKPGKFVLTPTGVIKALGLICLLAGITFFLSSRMCNDQNNWRLVLFSFLNSIVLLVSLTLYLIFSMGLTVNNPWLWVKLDIIINIILPLLTIILSIVTTSTCSKSNQLHNIPLPVVITGNILMLFSTATLFLLYRYKEDNNPESNTTQPAPKVARKSIFA